MTSMYPTFSKTDPKRTEALRSSLAEAQRDVHAACRQADRAPDEVRIIAVTKTHPPEDAATLVDIGQIDLGENKAQEGTPKAEQLRTWDRTPRWHFLGQLQRNKVRSVVSWADWIHSVDRTRLVDAVDRAAVDREISICLQVNLNSESGRGGVLPGDLEALAEHAAACSNLRVRGVMAVAPLEWESERAFERLADMSRVVRRVVPDASEISAGMTDDFTTAIEYGSTMVRLGSKILGRRHGR